MSDVQWLPLAELTARWRPGSYDPPWSWSDENTDIDTHAETPGLVASISAEGIREPIYLGDDGRVWDGHHRVCIAGRLGINRVPVVFGTSVDLEPGGDR